MIVIAASRIRYLVLAGALALGGELPAETHNPADTHQVELAQYRADITKAASAYKRYYPKEARQKQLEGKVVVQINVDSKGGTSFGLKTSSGHEILDRQALGIVKAAAGAVPVPPGLKGAGFSVDVAIMFALQ